MILGKKDVAESEWTSKWRTPAILAYPKGVRTKHAQTAIQEVEKLYTGMMHTMIIFVVVNSAVHAGDTEEDEKRALYLLVSLMAKKEHFSSIYEEFDVCGLIPVVFIIIRFYG